MMKRISSLSVAVVFCVSAVFANEEVVDVPLSIAEEATEERVVESGGEERERAPLQILAELEGLRIGVEGYLNAWNSTESWEDGSFQIPVFGFGLFFRILPEPLYITTGIYFKREDLEKKYSVSMPVDIMGVPIGNIPIVDFEISKYHWSMEIPILLNYMLAKQVRLTAGALLDFNISDEQYWIEITTSLPSNWPNPNPATQWARSLQWQLARDFNENGPTGNLYWVFGIDLDIFKYWGIGVKYMIHNHCFGGSGNYDDLLHPSKHQLRISTYFVH